MENINVREGKRCNRSQQRGEGGEESFCSTSVCQSVSLKNLLKRLMKPTIESDK